MYSITNDFKFNRKNNYNYNNVTFKQKIKPQELKHLTKEAFILYNTVMSALGAALIGIGASKKEKVDHSYLAQEISRLLEENKNVSEICAELGISKKLYCNIIKEFDIKTKTRVAKQNRANIDLEAFINDINAQLTTKEILAKHNITIAQYHFLIKSNNLKSKRMLENDVMNSITKEKFLDAVKTSSSKSEVCRKLGLKSSSTITYNKLTKIFGIEETPINTREKWKNLTSQEKAKLFESGKSLDEIKNEYNVSKGTIQIHRKISGVKTPIMIVKENKRKIDIQEFQKEIDKGEVELDELLKKYNITKSQLQDLIYQKLITTPQKKSRNLISNITKEYLQKVIDESGSTKEVYTKLGIAKGTFYNLVRLHKVSVPWLVKRNNAEKPVTKEELTQAIEDNLSIAEVCEKFGITQYIYYKLIKEYDIGLRVIPLLERFKGITPEILKMEIAHKDSHKEVMESLGITRGQFNTLLKEFGIVTEEQKTRERINNISKEMLLNDIMEGMSVQEISEKYNISIVTADFLLKEYSINNKSNGFSKRNAKLENMDIQGLKKSLVNLFVKNEIIGKNKAIANIINNIFSTEYTTEDDRLHLIALNRVLQNVVNNNLTQEEALSREEVKYFTDNLKQ